MLASMREAKLDSIQIKPEPAADCDPSQVCTIQFKGPSGQKLIRKFHRENQIQDLINYYKHEAKETCEIALLITFPKKDLSCLTKTLDELAFSKQETVMVK